MRGWKAFFGGPGRRNERKRKEEDTPEDEDTTLLDDGGSPLPGSTPGRKRDWDKRKKRDDDDEGDDDQTDAQDCGDPTTPGARESLTDEFRWTWCSPEDDIVVGTDDNDIMLGCCGNDSLVGAKGNDIILGGYGNDYLSGNQGNDLLIGGKGADIFVFDGSFDHDTVRDFTPGEDGMEFIFYTAERAAWTVDTVLGFFEQIGENLLLTLPDRGETALFEDVDFADLDPSAIAVIQYDDLVA